MQEIAPGIWHWKARHPHIGMEVSSYFLPGQGMLLDPLAVSYTHLTLPTNREV